MLKFLSTSNIKKYDGYYVDEYYQITAKLKKKTYLLLIILFRNIDIFNIYFSASGNMYADYFAVTPVNCSRNGVLFK